MARARLGERQPATRTGYSRCKGAPGELLVCFQRELQVEVADVFSERIQSQ